MLQFLYNFSGRKNHSYKVTKLRGYDRNFRQIHPRILPYLHTYGCYSSAPQGWKGALGCQPDFNLPQLFWPQVMGKVPEPEGVGDTILGEAGLPANTIHHRLPCK